ncbi:MAG: energy-coupling factor transporter ATPase [Eubacterium sp.]|nr:energy-coupling factor transporter ATPase [Eubacterium sp.]
MSEEAMIRCEDLVFEYKSEQGAVRALDGVSLCVKKGEFAAIVGRNGSGKTTLAKCLNALYVPDAGKVLIDGMDTRDESHLWDIRQSCGMVFQNPDNQLVSSIVEDDVAFGPENLGLPPALIEMRVKEALDAVGMSEYARRAPHMLSGGQKQRIAIAGVLAMKPRCIIMDEPTAMLDPKGRKEIMDMIDMLMKEDISIVLITHFMDEAVKADRIYVMDAGKVIKEGTPEQIFNDDEIAEAFKSDLPTSIMLARKLREGGMDVPREIVTEDQLLDMLSDMYMKKDQADGADDPRSDEAPAADDPCSDEVGTEDTCSDQAAGEEDKNSDQEAGR